MTPSITGAATSGRKIERRVVLLSACGLLAGGLVSGQSPAPSKRRVLHEIPLPRPQTKGKLLLEEVLARRRSVREFVALDLSFAEIGQLMWAGQGITDRTQGFRTAPSAGATYPLEIYLVTHDGLFHHVAADHRLEQLSSEDLRRPLAKAAADQDWIAEAALNVVIACVRDRTRAKYGDRAERYIQFEVGHAAQNILLQAAAMGLGGAPVGAIYEDQIKELLGLPEKEEPLYLLAIGHPR